MTPIVRWGIGMPSVLDTIAHLNKNGETACPEGFCVVLSRGMQQYFLLYREDIRHFSDDLLQWASCTAWAPLLPEGCKAGSVAPPDLRCAANDVRGGSLPPTPACRALPGAGRVLVGPAPPLPPIIELCRGFRNSCCSRSFAGGALC